MWTELFADVTNPESPRRIFYGAVALALITGLLAAFSMVCSQQVHRAQERDASLQVRRAAISDCVQYARFASLDSCIRHVAANPAPGNEMLYRASASYPAPSRSSDFVPVNLAYR